ncbi:3-deoxy-7-phosphoheptulonate synthase [Vallitaleaceae bacterium 9-2]
MSFKFVQNIQSPEEIKMQLPVSKAFVQAKIERDKEIQDIFRGKSDKFLMIVGPCSADNEKSVLDYIERLYKIQEQVEEKILIIPRIYTNKPRTTGEGYKGMLHQPDPLEKADMEAGIKAMRAMHVKAGELTGMSSADEMLYPDNHEYLDDILSYVAVGARSVENQQHRVTASGIDIPAGMKNPTSGDTSVMLNAIRAAQIGHNFIYRGQEVRTEGNPFAHAIMRGFVNQYGRNIPNYHFEDLKYLIEQYLERDLKYPSIIVDVNHSNSNKQFQQQPRIADAIMRNRSYDSDLKQYVKGIMVESYIEGGSQKIDGGVYGKSITDPCLSIMETQRMILNIAEKL